MCGDRCDAYCNNMLETCDATDYKYADRTACMNACSEFPDDPSKPFGGNSLQCRNYHALVATTSKNTIHCGHAWPLSVDKICGTKCEAYCTAANTHCTGINTLYADMDTCLRECSAFPADGAVDASTGDSIQCRAYHGM